MQIALNEQSFTPVFHWSEQTFINTALCVRTMAQCRYTLTIYANNVIVRQLPMPPGRVIISSQFHRHLLIYLEIACESSKFSTLYAALGAKSCFYV